jgi:hypothetical protein
VTDDFVFVRKVDRRCLGNVIIDESSDMSPSDAITMVEFGAGKSPLSRLRWLCDVAVRRVDIYVMTVHICDRTVY